MKTYRLENGMFLGVSYFTNVKNIKWLKEYMVSVFKDKSPVLINYKLIIDPFQIVVATNNAIMSSENTMKTNAFATEILYNLSSSNKISKSLKDMSVNNHDENMVVAIVSKFNNVPEMKIFQEKCINGCEADFSELSKNIDHMYVKSYYKIDEVESEHSNLLDSIVTRIACKPLD